MKSLSSTTFPYADITIDRFHVQKDFYDAMQQLRIKHRREAQRDDVEAREQFKQRNKKNADKRKKYKEEKVGKLDKRGRRPNRKNERSEPARLSNGDTVCELLARCRYQLMTSSEKWTESQKIRAKFLFDLYPDMRTAYGLAHSLRMIFSNPNATKASGRESLKKWYDKINAFDDRNFNTVAATIYERESEILNYFINRATNASAESFNSKINQFRAQLHGVVDVKFFLFRLTMIFG